jgi:HK97 family phage major capsid protein/HK97 family phage prohead protease
MFENPLLQERKLDTNVRRVFEIDKRSIDEGKRTVDVAITSEYPVRRWYGEEILSHEQGAIRLERLQNGGSLLFNHDVNALIGVVENVRLDADKVLRGTVRFGTDELSNTRFAQVKDGILRSISAGYMIHSYSEEKIEDTYRYIATDWEPYEVSFVTVPADPTVGEGRSFPDPNAKRDAPQDSAIPDSEEEEEETETVEQEIDDPQPQSDEERKASTPTATAPLDQRSTPISPKLVVKVEETKGKRDMTTTELLKEFVDLADLAGVPNARQIAQDEFLKETPLDQYRNLLLDLRSKQNADPKVKDASIGMSERDLSQYSIRRLISHLADPSKVDAGFEMEIAQDAARNHQGDVKGTLIPFDVLTRALGSTLGSTTGATNLVATELNGFIDVFRNALILPQMGATMLTGLQGNIAVPRVTTGNSVTWISTEGSQANASDLLFDQVALSPKTISARTQYTRQLMAQSSISVEGLVLQQLATVLALGLQQAVINGSGTSGVPRGILNTSGIGSVAMGTNGAAITFDKLVELETNIATSNTPLDSLGYLTNAKVRGAMKTIRIDAGSGLFLLDQVSKEANGYPVYATNAVPSNLTKGSASGICSAAIFGNWSELILAGWGGLEILVNPYKVGQGTIEVEAMQMWDVGVKHAAAFSAIQDILA